MIEVQLAEAEAHRARAWEYRMRAFKEGTLGVIFLMIAVIIYMLVTRYWEHLPS